MDELGHAGAVPDVHGRHNIGAHTTLVPARERVFALAACDRPVLSLAGHTPPSVYVGVCAGESAALLRIFSWAANYAPA